MNSINNNVNFGSKYNFTVTSKNNQHKKYLYNDVNKFIQGKGITTNFEIGNDKINMSVQTKKMAKMVSEGLKKLGINLAPKQK